LASAIRQGKHPRITGLYYHWINDKRQAGKTSSGFLGKKKLHWQVPMQL
jgi:hypothetical protein